MNELHNKTDKQLLQATKIDLVKYIRELEAKAETQVVTTKTKPTYMF